MKSEKSKTEKEVKLVIVRRHEPDDFSDLMLRLAPVFSEWQAVKKNGKAKNSQKAVRRIKP